jgi:Ras GTPase-activating-like protein IQGAP2/3
VNDFCLPTVGPDYPKRLQIAKMLQNLANKPSYSKEAYMMSLNPFVESNKARINRFLNDLCEVGDFYDSLEVGVLCGRALQRRLVLN